MIPSVHAPVSFSRIDVVQSRASTRSPERGIVRCVEGGCGGTAGKWASGRQPRPECRQSSIHRALRPRCAAAMPGLIEPSCSSSPLRVWMERLASFLPASNGDFRDAAMIVGDDQCIFSASWQALLVGRDSFRCQYPDFTSAFGGTADMAGLAAGLVPVENDPRADVGCLAASSVWTAVRAIANCGWSRYAALTV